MRRGLLALAVLAVPACGGGGGGGGAGPSAVLTVTLPGGVLGGTVTVSYALDGSGTWDAAFQFSLDGGATWSGAAPANGCPTPRQRPAPGSYTYLWDTVADTASGAVLVRGAASGSMSTAGGVVSNPGLVFLDRSATVDAGSSAGPIPPAHRGHYDLSPTRLSFLSDPALAPLATAVPIRSWRISVARWEIGPVGIMAPEPASYSLDPAQLANSSREFYRGPNTLAGAQDPANYFFGYLDGAIAAVEACGAEPYLCFDYVPFTLASNQNPNTADNLYLGDPNLSFSNGIRTSPPADNAVYAEVVKRVVMHVKGSFAGGLNRPLTHVEIGNEPDLVTGPATPARYFWTGTRAQFLAMYQACAAALDAQFGPTIRIGAGSFAFQPFEAAPTFCQSFLAGLGGSRLDFVGFHVYDDVPETGVLDRCAAIKALRDALRPAAEIHCPEWGMVLDGGPEFDDMTAALHHARALEYFLLFDVRLSHRALVRDIVPGPGGMGLLQMSPARTKPATHVWHAYEMLAQTPTALAIPAVVPAGKPMIVAGRGATAVTILFFHEAPPPGQVGRFTLTVSNVPFADWTLERRVLTDATHANGDGLWTARSREGSGAVSEELRFTDDTLVVFRLLQR